MMDRAARFGFASWLRRAIPRLQDSGPVLSEGIARPEPWSAQACPGCRVELGVLHPVSSLWTGEPPRTDSTIMATALGPLPCLRKVARWNAAMPTRAAPTPYPFAVGLTLANTPPCLLRFL